MVDKFQEWQQQGQGIGGDKDIEDFANQHGVGQRGVKKLREQVYGPSPEEVKAPKAMAEPKPPKAMTSYAAACRVFGQQAVDASHVRTAATKRQAWMGWGPQVAPKTRKVAGWDWSHDLEAYTASKPGIFECSCGQRLAMPNYHSCRCGKIWNGYVIGSGGPNHEASADQYLVREIPSRPDVIVANRQLDADYHEDGDIPSHEYYAGGEHLACDESDDDDFPSDHHPETPNTPATPSDWHSRDEKNNYSPQQLKKRRQ